MLKQTTSEPVTPQGMLSRPPMLPASPLDGANDPYTTDDEYLRMLRFYARSSRFVENQISAELEIEMASELKELEQTTGEWGW